MCTLIVRSRYTDVSGNINDILPRTTYIPRLNSATSTILEVLLQVFPYIVCRCGNAVSAKDIANMEIVRIRFVIKLVYQSPDRFV